MTAPLVVGVKDAVFHRVGSAAQGAVAFAQAQASGNVRIVPDPIPVVVTHMTPEDVLRQMAALAMG